MCDHTSDDAPAEFVSAAQVWDALEEEFSVDVPNDVRCRHSPSGVWTLVTCPGCGLEHFADAPQGDAAFYAALMGSECNYETDRYEFAVVRALVLPGDRVLDVGCGEGGFLRGLPATTTRVGIDHNGPALAALRRSDSSVSTMEVDAAVHADDVGAVYDVVTAFQILEHVEEPRRLLRSLRRLVRPGGSVYVSVPNLERSTKSPFEPLDHPPHHLTRWRIDPLSAAAAAEGLSRTGTWYEPPGRSVLTAPLERRLRILPTPLRTPVLRALRRSADVRPVRRHLIESGFYERRGLTGHTLLVRLTPS